MSIKRAAPKDVLTLTYAESPQYYSDVVKFLRTANPHKYKSIRKGQEAPQVVLQQDATATQQAIICTIKASGNACIPSSEDPTTYTEEDKNNVWSYERRLMDPVREVQLTHAKTTIQVQQFWGKDVRGYATDKSKCAVGSHQTGGCLWDAAVVCAKWIAGPLPQVLKYHPRLKALASKTGRGRHQKAPGWTWADKVVVELGAGLALPAIACGVLGSRVFATDGDVCVLEFAQANIDAWEATKARHCPLPGRVTVRELSWGDVVHTSSLLEEAGGRRSSVDVILMADCVYVLDNRGAWALLMRQVLLMSTCDTLIVLCLAQRRPPLEAKFLAKLSEAFDLHEVPIDELDATARQGSIGRIHQDTGDIRLFVLVRKEELDAKYDLKMEM